MTSRLKGITVTTEPSPPPVSARHLQMATLAGVDPDTEPATVAADILGRARSAIANHGGHPYGGWSMREQLAVALVLDDRDHLADMGYTRAQAEQAVADGMYFPPADMTGFLAGITTQLRKDSAR